MAIKIKYTVRNLIVSLRRDMDGVHIDVVGLTDEIIHLDAATARLLAGMLTDAAKSVDEPPEVPS